MNWHCATCFKKCIKRRAWTHAANTGTFLDNLHSPNQDQNGNALTGIELCKLVYDRPCMQRACTFHSAGDNRWRRLLDDILPSTSAFGSDVQAGIHNAFSGVIERESPEYSPNSTYVNRLDDRAVFTSKPAHQKSIMHMKMFIGVTPFECTTCTSEFTLYGNPNVSGYRPGPIPCNFCGSVYDLRRLFELPRNWDFWDADENQIRENLRCLIQ